MPADGSNDTASPVSLDRRMPSAGSGETASPVSRVKRISATGGIRPAYALASASKPTSDELSVAAVIVVVVTGLTKKTDVRPE